MLQRNYFALLLSALYCAHVSGAEFPNRDGMPGRPASSENQKPAIPQNIGYPLHNAAVQGAVETLKFLLDGQKMPVDLKMPDGSTPLYRAFMSLQIEAVSLLLSYGAQKQHVYDMPGIDKCLANPVYQRVIQALEGKYVPDKDISIGMAIDLADPEKVKDVLENPMYKAEPYPPFKLVQVSAQERVPFEALIQAIQRVSRAEGSRERERLIGNVCMIVRSLLQANAGLIHVCDQGTPLHYAAYVNSPELIDLLLQYGADIDAQDEEGRTPLYWALEGKKVDSANTLLAFNARKDLIQRREELVRICCQGAHAARLQRDCPLLYEWAQRIGVQELAEQVAIEQIPDIPARNVSSPISSVASEQRSESSSPAPAQAQDPTEADLQLMREMQRKDREDLERAERERQQRLQNSEEEPLDILKMVEGEAGSLFRSDRKPGADEHGQSTEKQFTDKAPTQTRDTHNSQLLRSSWIKKTFYSAGALAIGAIIYKLFESMMKEGQSVSPTEQNAAQAA